MYSNITPYDHKLILFQNWNHKSSEMHNIRKQSPNQIDNYPLVQTLKQKVYRLNQVIEKQKQTIEEYKKNAKASIINKQQVNIQKLNDENKKLLLLIAEMKSPLSHKKMSYKKLKSIESKISQKDMVKEETEDQRKKLVLEQRYYEALCENDQLKKQLFHLRGNQKATKKSQCFSEKNSLLIQELSGKAEALSKQNRQLEAKTLTLKETNQELKSRVNDIEEALEKALQVNKSMISIH